MSNMGSALMDYKLDLKKKQKQKILNSECKTKIKTVKKMNIER